MSLAALVLTGCPAGAELDDAELLYESLPNDYSEEEYCDGTRVLVESCGLGGPCHEAAGDGTPPSGGVDLVAPDVVTRLLDVPATFPRHPECEGTVALLIDSSDVEASYLWQKVNNTHGECGDGMPTPYISATALNRTDLDCLHSWLQGVVDSANTSP